MPKVVINPRTIVIPLFLAGTRAIVPGIAFLLSSPLITDGGALGDVTAITFCTTTEGRVDGATIGSKVPCGTVLGDTPEHVIVGLVVDSTIKGET